MTPRRTYLRRYAGVDLSGSRHHVGDPRRLGPSDSQVMADPFAQVGRAFRARFGLDGKHRHEGGRPPRPTK